MAGRLFAKELPSSTQGPMRFIGLTEWQCRLMIRRLYYLVTFNEEWDEQTKIRSFLKLDIPKLNPVERERLRAYAHEYGLAIAMPVDYASSS